MADLRLSVLIAGSETASGPIRLVGREMVGLTAAAGPAHAAVVGLTAGLAALGAAAAGGIAGLTLATKQAGELQQAVANISSIKPEIDTGGVFSSLNLMQTRVAQSSGQLAESLYDLFSSFEATQEQGLKAVEQFGRGAVAAQTDAKTFGTSVLGVLNAYGQTLEAVEHVQDVFFNTVNKGVVTGAELAAGLGLVTQPAKQAGLSIEELGGFIAGVTREGGPAAQNINNLANLLNKVNAKEAAEGFELLGIRTRDSTGAFRPLLDVFDDLDKRLAGVTAGSRADVIRSLFPDIQARAAANVVLNQLGFIREAVNENNTSYGAAARAYETMSKTFQTQSQLLGQSLQTVVTFVGSSFLPIFTAVSSGAQQMVAQSAPQFDEWQRRLQTAFETGGPEAFLSELGDVAGEIGRAVATWGPAIASWAEPAKERLGTALGEIWGGTVSPWIADRAEDLGTQFTEQWAPAISVWIEKDGIPAVKEKLGILATATADWVRSEGAAEFNRAGGEIISAIIAGVNQSGIELGNAIRAEVRKQVADTPRQIQQQLAQAFRQGLAPGQDLPGTIGRGLVPPLLGPEIPAALAEGPILGPAIPAGLLETAPTPTTTPTGGAPRQTGGTGSETVDLEALRRQQAEAERLQKQAEADAARAAEAARREAERLIQLHRDAVAAFDRIGTEGSQAFARTFGEGAKAAAALAAATEREAGQSQGAALAQSINELANQGRRLGVPAIEEMYADMWEAGRQAVLSKSEEAKQAALAAIRSTSDAIAAASTLSPDTFARAIGVGALREVMGSAFTSIWDAARRATEEGGPQNIAALAAQRSAIARTLFENRELSPERAQAYLTQVWDAIDEVVANRGPQSVAQLQNTLAQLNFDLAIETARAQMDRQIGEGQRQLQDAVTRAEMSARDAIGRIEQQAQTEAHRTGVMEALAGAQTRELDRLRALNDERQRGTQLERELADIVRDRAREDADTADARARQLEDLRRRAGGRPGATAGPGISDERRAALQAQGFGVGPVQDAATEIAALKERWAEEDRLRDQRRARQDADRSTQQQRAAEDRAQATLDAQLLERVTGQYETARRGLQTVFADADRQSQITDILARRLGEAVGAQITFNNLALQSRNAFTETETRLTSIASLAGLALNPMVTASEQIRDNLLIGAGAMTTLPDLPAGPVGSATGQPLVVQLDQPIVLDGQEIGRNVTRYQLSQAQLTGTGQNRLTGERMGVGGLAGFGYGTA